MSESLSAPTLDDTLRRLLARERSRRRDAALSRTFAATAIAAVLVAAWRIFDRVMGREPIPVAWALTLVALTALVGVAFAARAATCRSESEMAREVDRRLGLQDRATAALTILRGAATSRLAAFVVVDAENALQVAAPRIDAAFPSKPAQRVTAVTRWTAKIALVLVALAVLAELLTVGGPIHWLPGLSRDGGEPSVLVPPTKDAPHRDGKAPERPSEPDKPPKPDDPPKPETPKHPTPTGNVQVAIKPTKEEFEFDEPITAAVSATATGEIAGPRVFDLRVSVDGVEVDTGVEMRVDPSRPEGDHADLDLRKVPGLTIAAGEHVARARLATRTTHDEYESAPAKFRVKAKKSDDDDKKNDDKAGAPKPKPKPKPKPEEQPPQPQPQPNDPSKKQDQPPTAGAPPPPPALDKKVVVPLFGEGEEVKKRGLVLVLDPGGGIETPPKERPLDEALPDARRRAESAVDRAGVRDEDRELVRRYFDLLEGLRK
jgi:hypothetical protein